MFRSHCFDFGRYILVFIEGTKALLLCLLSTFTSTENIKQCEVYTTYIYVCII